MKTQALTLHNNHPAISIPAKSDIAMKVVLFAAILACINMIAFF